MFESIQSKTFSSINNSIVIFIIIHFLIIHSCTNNEQLKQTGKIDFSQADLMLEFLTELNHGNLESGNIELILKSKGTELIVNQMNIVRKVSLEQYGQLLKGLTEKQLPQIEPVDSTERAKRGLYGLTNDVWMVLNWTADHIDTLKKGLSLLKKADVYAKSENLANQFLPEPLDIHPQLFVVMGGRAGAAALEGNRIYIDVLLMTFQRVRKNIPLMNETEAIEYFAHEMHHIGLSRYNEKKFGANSWDANQTRLFGMLRSIVAEGSASYLISNHRNVDEMRMYFHLSEDPGKQNKLLKSCEEIIMQLSEGKFKSQDEYEKANTLMIGHGYHTVGSIILSTIDQAGGLESVKKVIADPGKLLIEYNKAVKKLNSKNNCGLHIFNESILGVASKLSI